MARWLLLGPDGAREQVMTARGERLKLHEGWRSVSVARFGDLSREAYDEAARSWRACPLLCAAADARDRAAAEAWLDGLPAGVVDLLAERVARSIQLKGPQQ